MLLRPILPRGRTENKLDATYQHRRLAFSDDVFGAAHGVGRIHLKHMAEHQPVEQHAERGQVLLDCGRRELALELLDECGHVEGLDGGEFPDAAPLALCREAARGIHVRLARVVVVDLGGEEFEDALGGFCRRREERCWKKHGGGRGEHEGGRPGHHAVLYRVL